MSLIIPFLMYTYDFTVYYQINEIREANKILFFDEISDRPPAASPY
jgi:hypothetical protein